MRQKSRGVTTASTAEGGNNLIGEERLIGEALIPTQELVFADFSLDTLLKKWLLNIQNSLSGNFHFRYLP